MNYVGYLKKNIHIVIAIFIVFLCIIFVVNARADLHNDRIDKNTEFLGAEIGGMDYALFSREFNERTFQELIVQSDNGESIFIIPPSSNEKIKKNLWKNILNVQNSRSTPSRLMHRLFFQKNQITLTEINNFSFTSITHDGLLVLYTAFGIEQVHEGEVSFNGNEVVKKYATSGQRFLIEEFEKDFILSIFLEKNPKIHLKTIDIQPKFSENDIDLLEKKMNGILQTKRVLEYKKDSLIQVILSSDDIRKLIVTSYNFSKEKFVFGFDEEMLTEMSLKLLPQDAFVYIDGDYNVHTKEERAGIMISNDQLRFALQESFADISKNIVLREGVREQAHKKGIDFEVYDLKHVVSEFTTYHGCCGTRVENIQLIADMLDGHILQPGEVLNINKIIGERTIESGFKPAGSILKGELIDSVGGGISQFITTLHNAVYWGGYEIVSHKPHSIYFSRYPKGVEATINWPYVDYIFRNDTDYVVMVDTEYTDTSITVRLLGDNADRVFIGDHRGQTWKNIIRTSDQARKVISYVSDPYNYRDPLVVYINDSSVSRGEQVIKQTGKKGWTVMVERKVIENGEVIHDDKKPVHYFSDKETIIHVHPCDNPSTFNAACYSQ
jgi:vancomycin resistance protein YoaR